MLENLVRLTSKLSKLFPTINTSDETMCNDETTVYKQGPFKFLKLAKDLVSSFSSFLSAKYYRKEYGGASRSTFSSTEVTKGHFFEFFH